jgi:ribosomal protein S18 acetylase RimI-like enzyme
MDFTVVPADSPGARLAMSRYVEELQGTLPHGFTVEQALADAARDYNEPNGLYVLLGDPTEPVAGGAVTFLDTDRAEVKRMWVSPAARGRGVARALLAELERLAQEHGRRVIVLDTSSRLTGAVALYDTSGYERVPAYNDNIDADLWFRKEVPTQ